MIGLLLPLRWMFYQGAAPVGTQLGRVRQTYAVASEVSQSFAETSEVRQTFDVASTVTQTFELKP